MSKNHLWAQNKFGLFLTSKTVPNNNKIKKTIHPSPKLEKDVDVRKTSGKKLALGINNNEQSGLDQIKVFAT